MNIENLRDNTVHDICIEIIKFMRVKSIELENNINLSSNEGLCIIMGALAHAYYLIGKKFKLKDEDLIEAIRLLASQYLDE